MGYTFPLFPQSGFGCLYPAVLHLFRDAYVCMMYHYISEHSCCNKLVCETCWLTDLCIYTICYMLKSHIRGQDNAGGKVVLPQKVWWLYRAENFSYMIVHFVFPEWGIRWLIFIQYISSLSVARETGEKTTVATHNSI